jgi:hypothetical protein
VLATQHFENYIDTRAVRQFFDSFFVVLLLVVNSMLQAQFFYPDNFSSEEEVPYISTPSNLPICTAAVPTPPATA